jgi:hypothetical protein
MTKTDAALYHAVNLIWNAVQTMSIKIKRDLRTADLDDCIETDLLAAHKALTEYRTLLRENKA